jgi:GNAT superfamily N-acetyltransferase
MIKPECLARYDVSAFVSHYRTLIEQGYTLTVAEADDAVVAVAIFHPDGGEIDSLYVAPQRRHQKTGTRLLRHVLDAMPATEAVLECAQATESGAVSGKSVDSSEQAPMTGLIPDATSAYRPGATSAPETPTRLLPCLSRRDRRVLTGYLPALS